VTFSLSLLLCPLTLAASATFLSADGLNAFNRSVEVDDTGIVHLDARPRAGVAWLQGVTFSQGRITLEVRGLEKPFESYVGVAFHGKDDQAYDAVFVRLVNLKAFDVERRPRAVHYVSHPGHTWLSRRQGMHFQSEGRVAAPPPVEAWVRLELEIEGKTLRVRAGDDDTVALQVELLNDRLDGRVGLWVGENSEGWFRGLTLQPGRRDQ
jgi:hypothetical protein